MSLRRNRGCLTCKDRKIKCDERWPVCVNCERGRRQCAGPTQVSVFVPHGRPMSSSPQITSNNTAKTLVWEIPKNRRSSSKVRRLWIQQNQQEQQQQQQSTSSLSLADSESMGLTTTQGIRYDDQEQEQGFSLTPGELGPPLSPLSFPESQRLSAELVCTLDRTADTGFTLRICGEHMGHLPSRIGHCKALDASISYLLSVHASLQNFGRVDSRPHKYRQYDRALRYLKQELEVSGDQDTEALVAATIVLSDAELLNNHTQDFLVHAGGSEAVLRGWGPKKVTSSFSKLLFVTLASGVIASSLLSGRDCFLGAADWANVFQSALNDSERGSGRHIWIQVWQMNARFPSIVQSMKNSPKGSSSEIRTMILDLWTQAASVEIETEMLLQNPDYMLEMPSALEQSPLPTYYYFQTFQTAEIMCHFWKLVMLLVQFMKACGLEEHTFTYNHNQPDIAAATKICQTVEYAMHTKPLGAWYMPLVLPLAAYILSDSGHLQQYAIWAYNDIVDAGLAIGLDMGAHGRTLMPATEGLHPAAYQQWWLGIS